MTFSIIVPVYNVAPYLRECLDSVLAQTCGDWECICVDDGSSDGSDLILDEYAESDARFRVFHGSNHGVSAARNKALVNASGEWIFFLDADDLLHSEALTRLAFVFQSHSGLDIIAAQGTFFQDGNQVAWPERFLSPEKVSVFDRICPKVVESLFYMGGRFSVRRKICQGVRFQSYRLGEDRLFMVSCFCEARGIALADFVTGAYRQRSSSASHANWTLDRAKEEFLYRMDCMKRTALSAPDFQWSEVDWMASFLQWYFPKLAVCSFRGKDRAELIALWYDHDAMILRNFRRLWAWHAICWVCHATRSVLLFGLLIYAFPRFARRLGFFHKNGGLT